MSVYTGSITLASVIDGSSGASNVYSVQASPVALYKSYKEDEQNIQLDNAETIKFYSYKAEDGANSILNPTSDFISTLIIATGGLEYPELWGLLDQLPVVINETSYSDALSAIRNISSTYVEFKIKDFLAIQQPGGVTDTRYETIFQIQSQLIATNCAISFRIYENDVTPSRDNYLAIGIVISQFNTTDHMAKFAITSGKITSAINNSIMNFTEQGLEIYNSGLTIYHQDPGEEREILLQYGLNPETRAPQLNIVGSGSFTGRIEADSGIFHGNVDAESFNGNTGTLSGWHMDSDGLYSGDWQYVYIETSDTAPIEGKKYYKNSGTVEAPNYVLSEDTQFLPNVSYYEQSINANIELLANEGAIHAKTIYLGTGAQIEEYIKLGNAYIRNPAISGGTFIETQNIRLTDSGVLTLGALKLDGRDSSISGSNWSITPNYAKFDNIEVSGKISTAVFEQSHVQAVGGSMIFKPSYHVDEINGNELTLSSNSDFDVDNYIALIDANGNSSDPIVITSSNWNKSNHKLTLVSGTDYSNIMTVINLGADDSYILAANAGTKIKSYAAARGFGIMQFNHNNQSIQPWVFMGDLGGLDKGIEGWGLYGQNVYLTGSLITAFDSESGVDYAGINTLNGVPAKIFGTEDDSKIVFWAGATGTTSSKIEKAKFQVTENGSLYAARGTFEGAILTKTTIEGAEIKTSRIVGNNQDANTYGLGIFDTQNGIAFGHIVTSESTSQEVIDFTIGNNGFYLGVGDERSPFIEIVDSDSVKFIGATAELDALITRPLPNNIKLRIENNNIGAYFNDTNISNLQFLQSVTKLGASNISIEINSNESYQSITLNAQQTQLYNQIKFDDQMQYKKVNNGYDLYVGVAV